MAVAVSAQTPAVPVHYPVGYTAVDIGYENNARALNLLARDLRAISAEGGVPALHAVCYTSPDADNSIALNVAQSRVRQLGQLFASRSIMADSAVSMEFAGIGWEHLAAMVEKSDLARRNEVLRILRMPDREVISTMSGDYSLFIIRRIKQIDGGDTYRFIESHYYPLLRNMLMVTTAAGDTARLMYRIGYSRCDMAYAGNGSRLKPMLDALAVNPSEVTVTCFLIPAGDNRINYNVAKERFDDLQKAIAEATGCDGSKIGFSTAGDGWKEIAGFIARSDMHHRDEAIRIINGQEPRSEQLTKIADHERVKALRAIDGGRTYTTLSEIYFPTLRNMIMVRAVADTDRPASVIATGASQKGEPAASRNDSVAYGRWALRTNMLYDLALAPTIGVEYRLTPHWSVGLDYTMAWWKNTGDNRTYQLAVISPEAVYRFSTAPDGRGHRAGIFTGFTWYDLSGRRTGHRGEGYFAGISYGYVWPVSRRVSIGTTLGVGYLYTEYKDYTPVDGHHVYRRTKNAGYFGPLKAEVSLIWRFGKITNQSR